MILNKLKHDIHILIRIFVPIIICLDLEIKFFLCQYGKNCLTIFVFPTGRAS